ncbi:hypothetical protein GC207_05170 [bacterium]|nr:hypothetical protein [bacterium]
MKLWCSSVIWCFASAVCLGQGTLNFSNIGSGVNLPVSGAKANAWSVELWAGGCPDDLKFVPGTKTDFAIDRYFNGGAKVLPGFLPEARPWIQLRSWDNQGGTITNSAQAKQMGASFVDSQVFQLESGLGVQGEATPNLAPFGSNNLDTSLRVLASNCVHQNLILLNVTRNGTTTEKLTIFTSTDLVAIDNWQVWSVVSQDSANASSTTVEVPFQIGAGYHFFKIAR